VPGAVVVVVPGAVVVVVPGAVVVVAIRGAGFFAASASVTAPGGTHAVSPTKSTARVRMGTRTRRMPIRIGATRTTQKCSSQIPLAVRGGHDPGRELRSGGTTCNRLHGMPSSTE